MLRTDNLREKRDAYGIARQAHKVVGSSVETRDGIVMRIIISQPIGIVVMRLKQAQAIGEQIHRIDEVRR